MFGHLVHNVLGSFVINCSKNEQFKIVQNLDTRTPLCMRAYKYISITHIIRINKPVNTRP